MTIRNLSTIARYGFAIASTAIALAATLLAEDLLGPTPSVLFYIAVIATAWIARTGPAVLAAALSAAALDYYFLDRSASFSSDIYGFIRIGLFFVAATGAAVLGNLRRSAEERAHQARETLKVTLASIGDAVIATDDAGRITFVNAVAEQLTRWTAKDAMGRPLSEVFRIINEESRAPVDSPFDLVMRTGTIVGLANHTLLIARDGTEIPVEDSGAPIRDVADNIIGVILVFRDGTERRNTEIERERLLASEREARAEAELAQERFEYLALASSVLLSSLDYESTLSSIARMIVPRLADWAAVDMLVDGQIKRVAVAHIDPAKVQWAWELSRKYPQQMDAPIGVPAVVRTGESEFIEHIPRERIEAVVTDPDELAIIDQLGLHSLMVVPIPVGERIAGAITFVTSESNRTFDENDRTLAEDVARRAGAAIEHAELYKERAVQRRSLEVTLASIGDGVIATDKAGSIVFMNPIAERLTGWSLDEALGRHVDDVFVLTSERTGEPVEGPVVRVLREGQATEIANGTLLRDRNRVERPVDDSAAPIRNDDGEITGVVMTFRDASERRRSERDVRSHRDQLNAILSGVSDGITAQDKSGRLIFANDAAARACGFDTAEELVNAPVEEVTHRFTICDEHGAKLPLAALPGRRALEGESAPRQTVQFVVNATGERRWSSVYATPVRDDSGNVLFAINIIHDITAARKAEIALHARARQQTAVAALGQRALAEASIDEVIADAVATVADILDAELVKVLELTRDQKHLMIRAGAGFDPSLFGKPLVPNGNDTQAGYTLDRKRPVIVDDLSQETRFHGAPLLHDYGVVSGMTVTIGAGTESFGILGAHSRSPRHFTEDDANFLESVANVIASSMGRYRALQMLEQQREWLRVTLASIGDAVIATDIEGRVTFMNAIASRLTGWSSEEVEGRQLDEVFNIINETTRAKAPNPVHEVLEHGGIVGLANHTIIVARDGTEVPIDDSAAPIRGSDGSVHGVVLVFHDVSERRKNEAELKLNESRFRLLVEQSPLAIQIFSPDGNCIQANRAWEDLWQTSRDQLVGYNVLEDTQLAANGILLMVQRAFAGEAVATIPVKYDPADIGRQGRPRWVRAVIYPVVDDTSTVREVVLVLEDVTERVVAEQRLQIQFVVSRVLAEAASIDTAAKRVLETVGEQLGFDYGALWLVDRELDVLCFGDAWVRRGTEASAFVEASRALAMKRGEGLPGRIWHQRAPAHIADLAGSTGLPRLGVALQERFVSAFGFPVLLGDDVHGVFEFFSRSDNETGSELVDTMTAVGNQIAQFMERRRAEEALRESEERYRTVAETASDAIFIIDQKSTIVFANRTAEDVFGYPVDELVGISMMQLMPDAFRLMHERAMSRYIETGVRTIDWSGMELPGLHRDGHQVPLEISFGEFVKNDEHFFTGIVRDITDRKNSERELQLAMERAEAANAAKDQFLAVLSHELRTPLTPVLTLVQFLETVESPPEDIGEMFTMIRRNIELEARLIDDLLDLTRITRGKLHLDLERVDTHALMCNVIDICREEIMGKGHELTLSLDAAEHVVRADPARLQQVYWNLIQNAVKFTPIGGRITVTSSNPQSDIVEIKVEDSGIGLEPEQLERVFNAFEQGEQSISRRFGGLGLGLSISRSIVDMHGGTIVASSDGPNRGSTFAVSMSTSSASNEPSSANEARDTNSDDESVRRILLVDDHIDTSSVMKLLLERRGYQVETAADVAGALALAESQHYDLLISDIGLPDGSGLELMQRIREKKPMPGIALSGFGMEDDIRRSHEAGFSEHLIKPVNFPALQEAIRRVMGSQ